MAGMTAYERQLRARLKDSTRWPEFERPDFLERLETTAERALAKRSVEGQLAAILIYHQLVEEILRLLIEDSRLLVQAALRPWRIEFSSKARQTFGQVQQELRHAVDFPRKERLLVLADSLNAVRIAVVHRLARRGSLAGLARDARKARGLYRALFDIFDQAHDGFRVDLHGFRKELL